MGFDPYAKFTPVLDTLNAISRRQQMISGNIANVHTPGYTAKTAEFSDLLFNVSSPFETKLAKQMGASLSPMSAQDSGEPVNLQKEMLQMQKNMLFYSMTTRRAASIFNSLRTASQIGR